MTRRYFVLATEDARYVSLHGLGANLTLSAAGDDAHAYTCDTLREAETVCAFMARTAGVLLHVETRDDAQEPRS